MYAWARGAGRVGQVCTLWELTEGEDCQEEGQYIINSVGSNFKIFRIFLKTVHIFGDFKVCQNSPDVTDD